MDKGLEKHVQRKWIIITDIYYFSMNLVFVVFGMNGNIEIRI